MTDKLCKNLVALFAALITFVTFFLTMAPTVSFWDCGEFIASAYTLGIPHPPGRPFFVLFARVVIILLPMVEEIAKRLNYISVFASAAAVYVTVLFVWDLLAKLMTNVPRFISIIASLSAGLLLTFSDTFWFNGVEAEVYNLVMFVVLLMSYLALKYLDYKDESRGTQYLIFICYLAFLGMGFHFFSMLTVPAIFVLVLLANGTPFKDLTSRWPLWVSGTVLCSTVYAISSFIVLSFVLLLVLLAAWLYAKDSPLHKDISLSLALTIVAIIGFSTHLYLPIRSALNPIINENAPGIALKNESGQYQLKNFLPLKNNESWRAFYDYLERKQYGSESMIRRSFYRRSQFENQMLVFPHMGYGGWQIAQYTPFKPGEVYYYRPGIYAIEAEGNEPVVRGSIKFPTLMISIGENKPLQAVIFLIFNGLLFWVVATAFRKNKTIGIYIALLYGLSSFGLLWYLNFADGTKLERHTYEAWTDGMQRFNAEMNSGVTNVPNPNVLLGIQRRIANGEKSAEQTSAWQNWQRIRAAFQREGYQAPSLPDPVHLEVRNRDYFYSPAFMFMSLLYGLGIGFLLINLQRKRAKLLFPSGIAIVVLCGAIPLFANYKEHNRSNLWVPWDYAYNLLMSCEPNAILFTNGDNDTFPLWFAQEVVGIRKDVRVVNLSLGNTDWYIKQMLENEPILKLSFDKAGIDEHMVISEKNFRHPSHTIEYWLEDAEERILTLNRHVRIFESRLEAATTAEDSARINAELERRMLGLQVFTALRDWAQPRKNGTMQTQNKLVVDLTLNNPEKPIHVSTTVALSNAVGLDKYMVQKGMIWDLIKGTLTPTNEAMDIDRTAFLIDSVFKFRGLGDSSVFINYETERLLFGYNSMYIRIAMAMRDSLILDRKNPRILEKGLRFLDLGTKQFPREWRNYAIASELLMLAEENDRAIEYLENGLRQTSKGSMGERYLAQQLQQFNAMRNINPIEAFGELDEDLKRELMELGFEDEKSEHSNSD
ncbi:MAG: DUF2723 domain-containing protein [Fibromonadaceae bacterium]|jgi:hypothetical protein|nr:DUF2723 domain-containing protein [Fibromonadaceae bacterium]